MSAADLNLLTALDALLAEASVAGAARRLQLSASAMSRTLARLRTATGDPLLVRAGRRMVLTPRAVDLRDRVKNLTLEAHAMLQPRSEELDLANLQRTFVLRTNDGFVEAFAAHLIATVRAAARGVRLHFVAKSDKSAEPLRDGRIDLEIGVLGDMGPEVRIQALFRDRFIGVVRSGHPLAAEPTVTAARYVEFGHVIATRSGRAEGPVDEALAALGLARHIDIIVPGFPAALAVARASDLIALVPQSMLATAQDAAYGDMVGFPLPVTTAPITISQMWHPRLEGDLAHRWLRTQILAACRLGHFPSTDVGA